MSRMYPEHPFSNGTEGDAWMSAWCEYCIHDHSASHTGEHDNGCEIIAALFCGTGTGEALVAEPDDGRFFLPSRMICTKFEPCHKGTCEGDPGADERAERVAEVMAYWRARV